jgi:hypothetical protein
VLTLLEGDSQHKVNLVQRESKPNLVVSIKVE